MATRDQGPCLSQENKISRKIIFDCVQAECGSVVNHVCPLSSMMAISMMAIAIVAITIVAITIVAITITSIVAVVVVVIVPSATEPMNEVVQSVANIVAHICPCRGTSESTCRIKIQKTPKQISTTNRKETKQNKYRRKIERR